MRYEEHKEYAGKGTTALGTIGTILGSIGTAAGTGILNGVLGGGGQQYVSKDELAMQNKITEKDMEIAFLRGRDAAKSDTLETYGFINGELTKIREELAEQRVKNAQIEGAFTLVSEKIACCKNEFAAAITREHDERCCADNSLLSYIDANFYRKMVADVTTGTTTTAQMVYSPLPNCSCR